MSLGVAGVFFLVVFIVVFSSDGAPTRSQFARPLDAGRSDIVAGQPAFPPANNALIHSLLAACFTCRPRESLSVALAPYSSNSLMIAACCRRASSEPLPL